MSAEGQAAGSATERKVPVAGEASYFVDGCQKQQKAQAAALAVEKISAVCPSVCLFSRLPSLCSSIVVRLDPLPLSRDRYRYLIEMMHILLSEHRFLIRSGGIRGRD